MKAFGLELRKMGNVTNLYADVDLVLSKHKIPAGGVSGNVQVQALAHALQKMINVQNYFDVCTIDNCAEMMQIVIPSERKKIYRAAHCIRWNEMTSEYRQVLVAMVLDDFRAVLNPHS